MPALTETLEQVQSVEKYKYGFVTDIETDSAPKGLNEDIVRFISAKKNEPKWLLDWRLKAFRKWKKMSETGLVPYEYEEQHKQRVPKLNTLRACLLRFVDMSIKSKGEKKIFLLILFCF